MLYVTPGYQLIALDALTGNPVPEFGNNGVVDLKQNLETVDVDTADIGLHATPIVAKDVVIVGAAHRTGGNPRSRENVKGFVRGLMLKLANLDIPHDTQARRVRLRIPEVIGNTGVWAQISVDPEPVYLPVEAAT